MISRVLAFCCFCIFFVAGAYKKLRFGLSNKTAILRRDYRNLLAFVEDENEHHQFLQYDIEAMKRLTRVLTLSELLSELPLPSGKKPEIYVVKKDTLDAAVQIIKSHGGDRVAVLNMANSESPCGNVQLGPPGQEQELCRRSALAYSLMPRFNKKLWGDNPTYSIPDDGVIYSPIVPVFLPRKSFFPLAPLDFQNDIYTPFFHVDVISSSAVNANREGGTAYYKPRMYAKIRAQLAAAAVKGVNHLVLGAFGCGAYGGDPQDVSELYRVAIDKEYGRHFKSITFAIYDAPNRGSEKIQAFSQMLPVNGNSSFVQALKKLMPF